MAAPNVLTSSSVLGKTAVQAVGTSATAILTNSAASGKLLRIVSLYVSNVDGVNNADITVDLYRSTTAYHVAKTVVVAADSAMQLIAKEAPIYLEEGDSLRLTASASGDLEAICSYEEVS